MLSSLLSCHGTSDRTDRGDGGVLGVGVRRSRLALELAGRVDGAAVQSGAEQLAVVASLLVVGSPEVDKAGGERGGRDSEAVLSASGGR